MAIAAGRGGPDDLAAAYETCRRLNADHGRTYYLATLLLPPVKRPAVHALYAFARYADEIVDSVGGAAPERAAALDELGSALRGGPTTEPVVLAVRSTMRRWTIPAALFEDFLASMRQDLTVTEYPTYADLQRYMWGSAAVIGLQMVHILGTTPRHTEAEPYAVALGQAFQLTNFLRDIGEDLDRGRVYLPVEDLAAHGYSVARLAERRVDGAFRRLMVDEIHRARELYAEAAPGIDLLVPASRDCVRTALRLYAGILDEIERADYDVFSRRVRVGPVRRAAVAGPGLLRAVRARRRRGL